VLVENRNLPSQTRRTYRTYFYIGGPALAAVGPERAGLTAGRPTVLMGLCYAGCCERCDAPDPHSLLPVPTLRYFCQVWRTWS
jgi:hypothetical protein